MNKIFLTLVLFFGSFILATAQTEKLNRLFDQYQNTDGVTSIKIAKEMFSMLGKVNLKDSELNTIQPLLSKIEGLRILMIEPQDISSKKETSQALIDLKKEILTSVNNLKYDELLTLNNKDTKIKFLTPKVKDGIMDNLLLNINDHDTTILMMLDGKISKDDLNQLMNKSNPNVGTKNNNSEAKTASTSSEVREVGAFTGLEISSGIDVKFTQNKTQNILVEADSGKLQYIVTEVKNGILKIYIDHKEQKNISINNPKVIITAPGFEKIIINSGATFTTQNTINGTDFYILTESASKATVDLNANNEVNLQTNSGATLKGNIKAAVLTYNGTSASSGQLSGTVNKAYFTTTSAATCNAKNLFANTAVAEVTSASTLFVNAKDTLQTKTSSAGSVKFFGNPEKIITKNNSGGSTKPVK